ncbi:MAG: spore germination protein [Firmicutes bacterium]|nr:spore germination protein [Bacillota bacterium]
MDRISFYLEDNINRLKQELNEISNLVLRSFYIAQDNGSKRKMLLAYFDGMNDKALIDANLLSPLMNPLCIVSANNDGFLQRVVEERLAVSHAKNGTKFSEIKEAILNANCVLLADGCCNFYIFDLKKFPVRSVTQPDTDMVIRGPREGFTENIQMNMSMLRRRLKVADFKTEVQKIGRYSQTDICICYIESIVKRKIVDELKSRLERIDIDGILDSGYIEQLIEDAPLSLFPTVGNSEKPDIIAAKMLEGKIAIIVDGSPIVLFVPKLFPESFQVSEDYYNRFYFFSFIRLLRWMAFFIAIFVPGFYISITTYHQEMLPSNLIMTMAAAEQDTPFSSGFSMLLMIIIFEILREVGVRLPGAIGQTVGIVGALIMGDAAVSANIISAPVLIVMALTVICSYVSPSLNNVVAILRFIFIFAGWALGGFGIMMIALLLTFYAASLRSFGIPYLSPIAPFETKAAGDIFVRKPLWSLIYRPRLLTENRQRMKKGLKPHPPVNKGEKNEN